MIHLTQQWEEAAARHCQIVVTTIELTMARGASMA